ncbi:MAG: hypothetical protein JSS81_25130 [Acidobacteria bacterium]|nr:hypothetical protein [Acidobacteriota bacterium]
MDYENYWTGFADLVSNGGFEMPRDAVGLITMVVAFAGSYDEFFEKVGATAESIGLKLIWIDEPETIADYLKKNEVAGHHEIFELLAEAERHPADVHCGDFFYYTHDDA